MPLTLHARLREARARLTAAGIPDAEAALDADLLARHVLGWTREQIVSRWLQPPAPDFDAKYAPLIERRAAREPIGYIIGVREFWGLEMEVTRDVLIPRPETELIVEETLGLSSSFKRPMSVGGAGSGTLKTTGGPNAAAKAGSAGGAGGAPAAKLDTGLGSTPTIVDVGTGSGCVAVALATELRRAKIIAIDVSTAALHVAKRNADRHDVSTRITWHAGSLLEPIDRPVDLIVSNPPYVPLADAASLPPEVREFEPSVALFSGDDGLATIRALVAQAVDRVRPGGWLIFEFGFGQADAVTAIVEQTQAWRIIRLRADLQGIPRTAVLQRL